MSLPNFAVLAFDMTHVEIGAEVREMITSPKVDPRSVSWSGK